MGAETPTPEHDDRRPRVLLLLTSLAGGAGFHAYSLAKHLPRDAYDLTVAFGPGYPLDGPIQELGVPVHILSISRKISPFVNLRGFFQVRRLIRQGNFDLVVTACSIAGLTGRVAAAMEKVPKCVHILHVYASHPNQNAIKRGVYRWIENRLDPVTTRYVAVCNATRDFGVQAGIMSEDRVEVIYNAIALPDEEPVPVREIREELGVRPDAQIVGTAGRFEPQKGLDDFLRAAAIVLGSRTDTQFLIVGDGPLRPRLEALADELGINDGVVFAGWRTDVLRLLPAMDVFCLSSHWEQFPYATLEAMAMSRPVVATSVDGTPEAVLDGVNGYLAPSHDPPALAAALGRMLDDPEAAKRMGEAGRALLEERFTLETMVARFDEFLHAVLAEQS